MARSRLTGLRSRRSLGPHDFALCRWRPSLWFRRCAYASHLAVISAVDLANGEGRGLGLVHCLEPSSIVSQKALGAGRQVIETIELGHHEPGGKIQSFTCAGDIAAASSKAILGAAGIACVGTVTNRLPRQYRRSSCYRKRWRQHERHQRERPMGVLGRTVGESHRTIARSQ
jgi:hypothetical protein